MRTRDGSSLHGEERKAPASNQTAVKRTATKTPEAGPVNGTSHTVFVPPGMLDDIVKPMWGEFVVVEAMKKKAKLHFSHFVDESPNEKK